MTRDRPERPLAALVDRLRDEAELLAVYRFGSLGSEYERPASDLDLAVYAGAPLPTVQLWRTTQELAAEAGRDVGVVDLASASGVRRAQVIHEGERIYCADETARDTFEDYVYSSYARLNEERRGILRDILRRGAYMADEVVLNKAAVIERCPRRISEEYVNSEAELASNCTRQDAIVLNLLRASEAGHRSRGARDAGRKPGLPQESREAFVPLERTGWTEPGVSRRMQAMVGFRNVAVHDYQKLSLEVVKSILENRLDDFQAFATAILSREAGRS